MATRKHEDANPHSPKRSPRLHMVILQKPNYVWIDKYGMHINDLFQ